MMMKRHRCTASLMAALLLTMCATTSCSADTGKRRAPEIVGGPCAYTDIPGTVTLTQFKPEPGGIVAYFDFQPGEAHAVHRPQDHHNHLVLRSGDLPTPSWLAEQHLTVGSRLQAVRQDIRSGTCSPVLYLFPTLPEGTRGQ